MKPKNGLEEKHQLKRRVLVEGAGSNYLRKRSIMIHREHTRQLNMLVLPYSRRAACLVSKSFIAGIGLLVFSGLVFLFIITFAKPFIPNCYECRFSWWDALTYSQNHVFFFFDGLIAVVGAALIIGHELDKRSKESIDTSHK